MAELRCEACGMGFRSSPEKSAHDEKVHGLRVQLKCDSCNMVFKSDADLRDHNRKIHKM